MGGSPRLLPRIEAPRRPAAIAVLLDVLGSDVAGDAFGFYFSEHRDLRSAKRFFRKALQRHGRPQRIVIDGSQTTRQSFPATLQFDGRTLPGGNRDKSTSGKVIIEQDHRRIKRRVRPMLGFKSQASAGVRKWRTLCAHIAACGPSRDRAVSHECPYRGTPPC